MYQKVVSGQNRKVVCSLLILAILAVPLVMVQVIPTDTPQPYVFKARILEKLNEILERKIQYFLVERLEGTAPAIEFVVLIDRAYTRGYSNVKLEPNQEFWAQGSLMIPDDCCGKPFLFFEQPQIYVRQIKGLVFWPDQSTELKLLYQAPITRLITPVFVVLFPFMEEFTLRSYLSVIAQTVIIVATIVLLIKNRDKKENIVIILLVYTLLTMVVTIPVLTDLY